MLNARPRASRSEPSSDLVESGRGAAYALRTPASKAGFITPSPAPSSIVSSGTRYFANTEWTLQEPQVKPNSLQAFAGVHVSQPETVRAHCLYYLLASHNTYLAYRLMRSRTMRMAGSGSDQDLSLLTLLLLYYFESLFDALNLHRARLKGHTEVCISMPVSCRKMGSS
jgi:hypothetical protein